MCGHRIILTPDMQEHLAEHPWMAEYLDMPLCLHSGRVSVQTLEDDDVDALWASLQARRDTWRAEEQEVQQHFVTQIRGGRWTQANLGTVADCVAAQAVRGEPTSFCLKYALPKMSSYSFGKYGEAVAFRLAQEWCARMEHYYSMYIRADADFKFPANARETFPESEDWKVFVNGLSPGSVQHQRASALALLQPSNP